MKVVPFRLNVVGDFFVEAGCCTSCGVPQTHAPELFGEGAEGCYVKQQPDGPGQTGRMLATMGAQEQGCIKYKGTDEAVLTALREMEGGQDWIVRPQDVGAPSDTWWQSLLKKLGTQI